MKFYESTNINWYQADPYAVQVSDVDVNYRDDCAYPICVTRAALDRNLAGAVVFGPPGYEHSDLYSKCGSIVLEARIWTDRNVLTFWDDRFNKPMDLLKKSISLIDRALRSRFGVNTRKLRLFFECVTRRDDGLGVIKFIVETSIAEFLSLDVAGDKNRFFYELMKEQASDEYETIYNENIGKMKINISESQLNNLVKESILEVLQKHWTDYLDQANDIHNRMVSRIGSEGKYPDDEQYTNDTAERDDAIRNAISGFNGEYGYDNGDEHYGIDDDDITPAIIDSNYGNPDAKPTPDSVKPGMWYAPRSSSGDLSAMHYRIAGYPRTAQALGGDRIPRGYSDNLKAAVIRGNKAISDYVNHGVKPNKQ